MLRWIIWSVFAVAWTLALELPGPPVENLPAGEFIASKRTLVAKSAHVAVYAIFTALSAWVHVAVRFRWLMMFFLMAHACGSELLQEVLQPICFRGGTLTDVGLDVVGIMVGVTLTWKWWVRD